MVQAEDESAPAWNRGRGVSMKRPFLISAVLVAAGLVLTAIAAIGAAADPPMPEQGPVATPLLGPLTDEMAAKMQVSAPQLSGATLRQVDALLASSARLGTIVSNVAYEVDSVSEWTMDGQRAGAVAVLTLDRPLAFKGTLPGIDMGVRGDSPNDRVSITQPYVKIERDAGLTQTQSLHVFVDLNAGEVVQIIPGPVLPQPTKGVTQ